ncbi:H-NS histone family protein [Roseateles sp.]|uniref:H-NS histone family protein n=1 Tax=Roseateles sp. TaxID=1971397 RepID=UPI002DFC7A7C|nr:H-NS histone family protein [Roseateles sp.]
MSKSLPQLLKQIAELQKQAESLQAEKAGVIKRIREAIAHYSLEPEELFGPASRGRGKRKGAKAAPRKTTARKARPAGVAKYGDGTGRTWTGVGKRPNWFKDALAAGKTEADLLIHKG